MTENMVGPKLTDARFFGELVDCTLPGLEGIPAAAAAGDYATCRPLFAALPGCHLFSTFFKKVLRCKGQMPYCSIAA